MKMCSARPHAGLPRSRGTAISAARIRLSIKMISRGPCRLRRRARYLAMIHALYTASAQKKYATLTDRLRLVMGRILLTSRTPVSIPQRFLYSRGTSAKKAFTDEYFALVANTKRESFASPDAFFFLRMISSSHAQSVNFS